MSVWNTLRNPPQLRHGDSPLVPLQEASRVSTENHEGQRDSAVWPLWMCLGSLGFATTATCVHIANSELWLNHVCYIISGYRFLGGPQKGYMQVSWAASKFKATSYYSLHPIILSATHMFMSPGNKHHKNKWMRLPSFLSAPCRAMFAPPPKEGHEPGKPCSLITEKAAHL